MPVQVMLTMQDLARLVAHGLGGRCRGVGCAIDGDALLLDLRAISLAEWLPRLDVPVRMTWALDVPRQRLRIEGRVRLSGLASLLLVPGQHLGGGRVAIDALMAAVGLAAAVVARDNTGLDLDLARAPGASRWRLSQLALATGVEPGLVGSFHFD